MVNEFNPLSSACPMGGRVCQIWGVGCGYDGFRVAWPNSFRKNHPEGGGLQRFPRASLWRTAPWLWLGGTSPETGGGSWLHIWPAIGLERVGEVFISLPQHNFLSLPVFISWFYKGISFLSKWERRPFCLLYQEGVHITAFNKREWGETPYAFMRWKGRSVGASGHPCGRARWKYRVLPGVMRTCGFGPHFQEQNRSC